MNGTLRRGTVALSATVALLLASACGSDSGGSDGGAGWWHIQTGEQALSDLFPQLAEEFNEANDANIQPEPIANDDFKPALTTAMQAGDPPDIFHSWGGGVLAQYVRADLVRDITDEVSDVVKNMSPGALAPYTIDGRIYGLPFDMGMVGMWYNKALFEEAGLDPDNPPATWSEFLDAVTTLKEAGITPIALAGSAPWTQHYWFSYLAIRVMGVDGYTAAREAKSFDDPGFLRAAELWKELVDMEPFQSGFLQQGYGGEDSSPAVFGAGGAAMHLMGQWDPSVQESSSGTSLGDDLGWFPFPAVEGGQGSAADVLGTGEGFLVTAGAPDTTLDLLRFLYAEQQYQRIVDAHGAAVPVVSGFTSPDPLAEAQRATIAQAPALRPPLDTDLPDGMRSVFIESVGQLVVGRLAPADVISEVTREYQRLPGG